MWLWADHIQGLHSTAMEPCSYKSCVLGSWSENSGDPLSASSGVLIYNIGVLVTSNKLYANYINSSNYASFVELLKSLNTVLLVKYTT